MCEKFQQGNLKGIVRTRGKYLRKWENIVKIDKMKQVIEGVDWMHLTQDRCL